MGAGTTPRPNPDRGSAPANVDDVVATVGVGLDSSALAAASADLRRVLAWTDTTTWPEVAWQASALTPTGSPLEFVFSSDRKAIRYTAEVAGPEVAPADRLHRAELLLVERSKAWRLERSSALDAFGRRLQDGHLCSGAWIGGRHDNTGSSHKLYLEVAEGPRAETAADDLRRRALGDEPLMSTGRPQLRLVGLDRDRSRLELYYRVRGNCIEDLWRLLGRVGLDGRFPALLTALQQVAGRPFRDRLPGPKFGVSLCVDEASASVLAVTLFLSSRRLWGDDDRIGRQLDLAWDLHQSGSRPCDPPGSFAGRPGLVVHNQHGSVAGSIGGRRSVHNMAALTIAAVGEPVLQLGVSAPPLALANDHITSATNRLGSTVVIYSSS